MMRVEFYLALMVLAAGSAIAFGTRGEKWLGATILLGNLLTIVVERALGEVFASVLPVYLALDTILAAVLCAIAVRNPTWVAICTAAFQVNGTLAHLVKLVSAQTIPFSYAFLLKVWAWPMVLVLLVGRLVPSMRTILLARNWPPFAKRT
jgi:hypothetical protein